MLNSCVNNDAGCVRKSKEWVTGKSETKPYTKKP